MGPICQLHGPVQSAWWTGSTGRPGPWGPRVSDPGGGPRWPRRRGAGESSGEPLPRRNYAGAGRDSSTPHYFGRGRARSNSKTTAERSVTMAEAAVAGAERIELIGGEVLRARYGKGVTGRKASYARCLRCLLDARSGTLARTGSNGHRGHAGDEARWQRVQVSVERALQTIRGGRGGRIRRRGSPGERGVWAEGSGRTGGVDQGRGRCSGRAGEEEECGDARGSGARSSGVVEAEDHGGAVGLAGATNGRRWPRLRRSTATGALGHLEQRRGRGREGDCGRARVLGEGEGACGVGRRGEPVALPLSSPAPPVRWSGGSALGRSVATAVKGGTTPRRCPAGWACWAKAQWGRGASVLFYFLFCISFFFYLFSCFCFLLLN